MGTLYLVSTPIGNLEDITIRALHVLFSVDAIACEDTRVTGQLLDLLAKKYSHLMTLGKKPICISYRDTNEEIVTPDIIKRLDNGASIAIVSDAGTPLISDPGYRIVETAIKKNIPIQVIPGVTACVTALTGSGLPVHTFTFLGYLPEKPGKRKAIFTTIQESRQNIVSTHICYVAPHKLLQTLTDMEEILGNISIVVARELTKLHEEFWRGTLTEACTHFQNPKGEFVILFHLKQSPCNPGQ